MKRKLLLVLLGVIMLLTGCGRLKKMRGGSTPKTPPKPPFYTGRPAAGQLFSPHVCCVTRYAVYAM